MVWPRACRHFWGRGGLLWWWNWASGLRFLRFQTRASRQVGFPFCLQWRTDNGLWRERPSQWHPPGLSTGRCPSPGPEPSGHPREDRPFSITWCYAQHGARGPTGSSVKWKDLSLQGGGTGRDCDSEGDRRTRRKPGIPAGRNRKGRTWKGLAGGPPAAGAVSTSSQAAAPLLFGVQPRSGDLPTHRARQLNVAVRAAAHCARKPGRHIPSQRSLQMKLADATLQGSAPAAGFFLPVSSCARGRDRAQAAFSWEKETLAPVLHFPSNSSWCPAAWGPALPCGSETASVKLGTITVSRSKSPIKGEEAGKEGQALAASRTGGGVMLLTFKEGGFFSRCEWILTYRCFRAKTQWGHHYFLGLYGVILSMCVCVLAF